MKIEFTEHQKEILKSAGLNGYSLQELAEKLDMKLSDFIAELKQPDSNALKYMFEGTVRLNEAINKKLEAKLDEELQWAKIQKSSAKRAYDQETAHLNLRKELFNL